MVDDTAWPIDERRVTFTKNEFPAQGHALGSHN